MIRLSKGTALSFVFTIQQSAFLLPNNNTFDSDAFVLSARRELSFFFGFEVLFGLKQEDEEEEEEEAVQEKEQEEQEQQEENDKGDNEAEAEAGEDDGDETSLISFECGFSVVDNRRLWLVWNGVGVETV